MTATPCCGTANSNELPVGGRLGADAAPQVVGEQDGLGDLTLGATSMSALLLNGEVRLLLGDTEVALQDSLCAIEQLSRFKTF